MTPSLTPAEVYLNLVVALFAVPIVCGFFIKAPKLVMFGFIGLLFVFSDSTYGQLQRDNNIYSRGSGMFYFSLLNLILLAAGMAALMKRLTNPHLPQLAPPMTKYFAAFIFLLCGHVVVGLIIGVPLNEILNYNGMLNILNMLVFMYLLIMACDSEKDGRQLIFVLLALAAMRAIFGGFRYAFMGGDSANPYRNLDGMDIKIYFFDIGDNFIASLAAFCFAWLLTSPEARLSLFQRACFGALMLLEIAAVALSYRRSALVGLGLMFLFLLARLPGMRKVVFSVAAIAVLSVAASVFFENRLQFTGDTGGILSSMFFDIAPDRGGIENNRFYELYAAAQSVGSNWLFGLGTWGTFTGDHTLLAYHGGDYSFVHSGFGHIMMKAGLVGFLLFSLMLGAYVMFYLRHREQLGGYPKLLADAGFAGFLFWVPTLLIGTPIIEFRTMLLIGMTLALPFIAVGIGKREVHSYAYQEQYAAA